MSEILCPMSQLLGDERGFASCIKERCAWFGENECAVKAISSIAESLFKMRENDEKRDVTYEEEYDEEYKI